LKSRDVIAAISLGYLELTNDVCRWRREGVEKNEVEAEKWLEMAAEGDDPEIAEEARKELERLVGAEGPFLAPPTPQRKKIGNRPYLRIPGLHAGASPLTCPCYKRMIGCPNRGFWDG
jgi:TPR repeat protein